PATESNTPRTRRALSRQGTRSKPKSVEPLSVINLCLVDLPVAHYGTAASLSWGCTRTRMTPGTPPRAAVALASQLGLGDSLVVLFFVAFLKQRCAESTRIRGS